VNARQKFWLWVGTLVIVGMVAVPPWVESRIQSNLRRDEPRGYAPIFEPPRTQAQFGGTVVAIDTTRLGLQCGAAALLTGVLLVTSARPTRRD
jgi:hypothetical protein